jgi:hypothetical protein
VWPGLQPVFRDVLAGTSVFQEDLLMVLERRGWREEAYFTFSLSGIGDDEGAGVFCTCTETTRRVVGERRLLALGDHEGGSAPPPSLDSGVHAKIVSDRIGHAHEGVTVPIYGDRSTGHDREAAELVAA